MIETASLARVGRPLRVRLRSRALAVAPGDTTFAALGFRPGEPAAQAALERHGASFVSGYNAALAAVDIADLEEPLGGMPAAERGFAYEGSGMALALLDLLTPGSRDRLARLLRGHGRPYSYTIHVGAGWALARLRLRPRARLPALDPLLRWLALDGYGFHEGLFHMRRFVADQAGARRLSGYQRRVFDQGLGRSLWFVECADPERVAQTVGGFRHDRRADLWSGVGLAATYTTAVGASELWRLRELIDGFRLDVAQGAAFAAAARHHAGNVVAHTRMATELLCGRTVEEVAEAADLARAGLEPDPTGDSYERWRARLREWLPAGTHTGSQRRTAPPVVRPG